MSIFRTIVKIPKSDFKIDYNSKMLFLGSCFTKSIGNILKKHLFDIQQNPFGITYNPISIKNSLDFILENKKFTKENLHFHNEQWFSFHHHSKFSNSNQSLCLENINNSILDTNGNLKELDFIFLTFGTAKIYRDKKSKEIVANCHKLSANNFSIETLSVDEIVDKYSELIQRLVEFNPKIKIIFTVSPIRHWSDGAVQNQINKSTLILAINQLCSKFKNIEYLPIYEIFMDELRDYRFYTDDMLHPNETAIKYVWSKFSETFFEEKTQILIKKIESIKKASEHRPFNPNSKENKNFINSNIKKIEELEKEYPNINLKIYK